MIKGILGILVLLAIGTFFSDSKKNINLRTILAALGLQVFFGWFVLATPFGNDILLSVSDGASDLLNHGNAGIEFLFGSIVNFSIEGMGFIFAFKVLPLIIFTSALVSILYYFGVMQIIIRVIGGVLQKITRTSKAESTSAAANIFLGPTDAPLLVRPFIPQLTRSELFAVMSGGLATIAGSVLAGYAAMGIPMQYLIAASFMAAPGGLLFAKLLVPETEAPNETMPTLSAEDKPANVIDAALHGAAAGLKVAGLVGATLIAFIALISLLNGILGSIGDLFGCDHLTLELLLGYMLAPLAWLIGVPWSEAMLAGSFIGQKLVLNEFVAYMNFAPYLSDSVLVPATNAAMTEQSRAIISFALCGFANFGSIAMVIGTLSSMAPDKTGVISTLGMRALLAGTLSNLSSAAIAGMFLTI